MTLEQTHALPRRSPIEYLVWRPVALAIPVFDKACVRLIPPSADVACKPAISGQRFIKIVVRVSTVVRRGVWTNGGVALGSIRVAGMEKHGSVAAAGCSYPHPLNGGGCPPSFTQLRVPSVIREVPYIRVTAVKSRHKRSAGRGEREG